jgi:CRP-like cAMP-binding protein
MPGIPSLLTTRNGLLAALHPDVLCRLLPKLESVSLQPRQTIARPETPIDAAYFPESGWISMVASVEDGMQAEVGLIGREGMAPLPLIAGVQTSFVDTYVQASGTALRMNADHFRIEMESNRPLRELLLRYSEAMHAQTAQTAACNGCHGLEQRLARWLLMAHDRIDGNKITVTHELLALMLCVYRPSITIVVGVLQKAGIISTNPGAITVVDRHALAATACGCYKIISERFRSLLG